MIVILQPTMAMYPDYRTKGVNVAHAEVTYPKYRTKGTNVARTDVAPRNRGYFDCHVSHHVGMIISVATQYMRIYNK